MDRPLLVYTTFPDRETGLAIGEKLVRARLAACVNVIPGMESVYSWKGAVERGAEAVGLVKTRAGLRGKVVEELRRLHPYETPIVLCIDVEADDATGAWIDAETREGTDADR